MDLRYATSEKQLITHAPHSSEQSSGNAGPAHVKELPLVAHHEQVALCRSLHEGTMICSGAELWGSYAASVKLLPSSARHRADWVCPKPNWKSSPSVHLMR